MPSLPVRRLTTAALLVLALAPRVWAAEPRRAQSGDQLINWYYGAVYGTGIYAAGDRKVGILQLPFSHVLRAGDESRWGVELKAPVTFGFYDLDLDDVAEGELPSSISTLSVLPGIELDIPVLRNWRLRPYAQAGRGWELSGADSALIGTAGIKSRLTFPVRRGEFMLGNQLSYAAYQPRDGVTRSLDEFITGLNFFYPTGGRIAGRPADLGLHLLHYAYFNRPPFPLVENIENELRDEVEVGFSVRVRQPVSFELFELDMVGIAFRAGDNVVGIRLFFGLPY